MIETCRCGRVGPHCPGCGSINRSPLMLKSSIYTARFSEEIRCYRCRACGMEYVLIGVKNHKIGFVQEDSLICECRVTKDVKPLTVPSLDEDVDRLMDAVKLLNEKGYIVSFPNKDTEIKVPDKEPEPLPSGWTLNEQGQKVPPMTFEEILQKSKKGDSE